MASEIQNNHNGNDFETNEDDINSKNTKLDSILEVMDIQVVESEKRSYSNSMSMKDNYVVYLIECKITDVNFKGAEKTSSLWRRYSEFELLHEYLVTTFPYVVVPPLPEKRVSYPWQKTTTDKFDPDFIDRRRVGLENFLLRVGAHHILSFNKIFMGFLQQEDDWKESVFSTGYQSMKESIVKSLNASYRVKSPNSQFEESKNYSNELQSNVSNMLKVRSKIMERLYAIHKVHANYGREFSDWSAFEKQMGDALQSIGHFMDSYASFIDELAEEEENYVDQIKEYYYFADALRNVCRKHETLQYEVERAEENLANKNFQKDQVINGKSGLISRWFRSPDSEETKEMKVNNLNQQIQEAEVHLRLANEESVAFEEKALVDIERFKRQKVKDLRSFMLSLISIQMKLCKKGINTWSNVKECLEQL